MKSTPVRKLQNEHLLNEFEGLVSWAADDFNEHPLTPNASRRLNAARSEILKRMDAYDKRS